ncbi:hypothetical protein F2Q68_00038737 [Brassica cretica]|uniref:Uncharacterized protein n=1 Tax=Brassica cretica TaxID=69181 RepID=A0A8S9MPS0_BRACR|nr:hypothetical protein F2Q68_00038737 [Brassica cretica]
MLSVPEPVPDHTRISQYTVGSTALDPYTIQSSQYSSSHSSLVCLQYGSHPNTYSRSRTLPVPLVVLLEPTGQSIACSLQCVERRLKQTRSDCPALDPSLTCIDRNRPRLVAPSNPVNTMRTPSTRLPPYRPSRSSHSHGLRGFDDCNTVDTHVYIANHRDILFSVCGLLLTAVRTSKPNAYHCSVRGLPEPDPTGPFTAISVSFDLIPPSLGISLPFLT